MLGFVRISIPPLTNTQISHLYTLIPILTPIKDQINRLYIDRNLWILKPTISNTYELIYIYLEPNTLICENTLRKNTQTCINS